MKNKPLKTPCCGVAFMAVKNKHGIYTHTYCANCKKKFTLELKPVSDQC